MTMKLNLYGYRAYLTLLGSAILAGHGAVQDAGVHASCVGAYMVTLAVVLALHGDTHVS